MQAVVIAAGESSRFWPLNKKHKSQIKILGKSLIFWTLKGLSGKGIKEVIVVVGPDSGIEKDLTEECRDLEFNVSFVVQEKPMGTGDAIFRTKDLIKEPFFVFWPYKINAGEIVDDILKVSQGKENFVLTGAETATPWEYGMIKFENDKVAGIVENPPREKEPSNIKILGNYFFQPAFFEYYQKLKNHHPEDLMDALNLCIKERQAALMVLNEDSPVLKYPWQILEIAKDILESERLKQYISPGAVLGPNVTINGKVYIEEGVSIGANTVIKGPCYIGKNCEIGVNNVLRGPVNFGEKVKTGAFCEIKNSIIGEGTHLHSGYLGDSVLGRNCRLGAGVATANRRLDRGNIKVSVKGEKIDSSLTYLGAIIGDDTKIGIHCSLMPGLLIGSDCHIWPHSFVRENIEDNTTYQIEFKAVKKNNG